ncbi:hypothetical protein Bpro_5543 (plasmid) [Polaromonas sp. JS666]|nr:hypothetical protein Bpro_5543 [Polaromonas sp. JS666]
MPSSKAKSRIPVEHWRAPFLGLRDIPAALDDFELTTFFSYSAAELAVIRSLRKPLHRFGLAIHMGFIRMSGRTLDAVDRIPKALWSHLGTQLGIEPPEMGTLRSLYMERMRTLSEHQQLAYRTLGFQQMTEHQRRYMVRWLRETLTRNRIGSGCFYAAEEVGLIWKPSAAARRLRAAIERWRCCSS